MGARAVAAHGKAGGKGAEGSEGDDETGKTAKVATEPTADIASEAEREAGIVKGGPTEDINPQAFVFKYGDKEFSSQDELTEYLDSLSSEITETKKKLTTTPVPKTEPTLAPKVEATVTTKTLTPEEQKAKSDAELAEFFADPAKYKQKLVTEISTALQSQQQSQQVLNAWWESIYKDNNLTREKHGPVLLGIFQAHEAELGNMSLSDARTRFNEIVQNTFSELGVKPSSKERPSTRAVVEGASTPAPKKVAETEQKKPQTLSQMINARRKARQATPASNRTATA